MAILATGNTFADGDQVTSTKLNNIADAATFAADAVDDSTTALSGGKVIVKDAGITPAKLSTNHPNWDSTGLGVGTSSPSSKLDVETSSSSADGVDINNTSTGDPVIEFQLSGTSKFTMGVDNSDSDKFKIGTTAVETATCLTIDSTGPKITIGNGAAADTAIIFDGNAQDFYIALDDSADDLLIGLGSTIGTTPAISIDENLKSTFGGDVVIGGTTPTLTIGDAGAEDTAIVFDGNAKDFYIALDDSADKLVIGEGSTVGTNSILTITDDSVTIGDASAVDTKIVFDGNAQDFYIGLDDSADDLIIGVGSAVGTTPAISITDGRAVTLNTSLTLASGSTVTAVLDQDNMSSDSATSLATQQSIKAYVDAQVDTADSLSEILAIGNTSGGTDIELSTTDKTQFRDSAIYINSSTDGQLDIVADTEIQIVATTIDIDGAVALNGAITGATNITLSGELDAATLDISGVADIAGTTNLDVVDIDGAVDMASTLTVAGVLTGASLDISGDVDVDGTLETDAFSINGTTVSSTAAELNLLDGSSANTVVNSKAVIYGSSGEVAGTLSTAAQTSVTSLGTLTALTVDDVAINGKVITMTGSTSDTAVLTVGTNGTLSIVTTDAGAAAANIQITADGTVDIDSAGILTLDSGANINLEPASGSVILLDGTISVDAGVVTGATSITSTAFVGGLTGNASGTAATVTTAAQPNITSLGTLTALTVDNLGVNGNTITANSGALNLTPASGSAIVLDGTINVDAGVVTGATSITSTAFAGALTGDVTGNVSGTAATVTTAAQSNITSLGTLTTIDVNGTSNLDAVDIDGNVQIDGTVTVGINDTGKDVKFFGAADGAYMLWDESVDDLKLVGGAGFSVSGGLLDCSNASSAVRVRQQVASDRGYLYLYSENNYAIGRWYADANGSLLTLYETEAQQVRVKMGIDASDDGYIYVYSNGNVKTIDISGDGTIAKSSSTFNIPHPLESKRDTHRLVHSVIEGPQADLIYRGKVDLVDGSAEIDIDSVSGMTDGTFVVLCQDVQSFTTNESGWTAVRSSVSGNTLTIEAQDNTCTDSISWMVVGERQDDHMMNTDWTDENGKAIVEPLIEEEEEQEDE